AAARIVSLRGADHLRHPLSIRGRATFFTVGRHSLMPRRLWPWEPSPPDMDRRSPLGVMLGLAQHLARHRRDVAIAEQDEAQLVEDRVALGPGEVGVRELAGLVAQIEQERGDGVGYGRALGAQHAVAGDLLAMHYEHIFELRGVA